MTTTVVRKKSAEAAPAAAAILGKLVNRNNYPVPVVYANDTIMLPPNGHQQNVDLSQAGNLPVGVEFHKYQ